MAEPTPKLKLSIKEILFNWIIVIVLPAMLALTLIDAKNYSEQTINTVHFAGIIAMAVWAVILIINLIMLDSTEFFYSYRYLDPITEMSLTHYKNVSTMELDGSLFVFHYGKQSIPSVTTRRQLIKDSYNIYQKKIGSAPII